MTKIIRREMIPPWCCSFQEGANYETNLRQRTQELELVQHFSGLTKTQLVEQKPELVRPKNVGRETFSGYLSCLSSKLIL